MYVVLYTVRGRTQCMTLADQDWRLTSPSTATALFGPIS